MSDRHRGYGSNRDEYHRGGGGGSKDYRSGGYGRRDYDHRRGGGGGGYRGGGGGQYRGGGGYQGGNRGQQQQRYQSSYVGQKRGRDEPEAVDPKKQFIMRLLKLGQPGPLSDGDKTSAGDTPDKTIENAVWAIKQEIKHSTENLNDIVLEAVVSCSHKTTHYALLLGLLNSEKPDWLGAFTAAAGKRFEAELAAGEVTGPRLLLRFFACLSLTNVLHHADVLGLLQRIIELAQQQAASGDLTGLTWQPWADQLVYMVLGALVWGGKGLAEQAEHATLLEAVAAYMASRPMQESVELRPMYGASDVADASAASDSGGASFLGQLWDAVQALHDPEIDWHVKSIPNELLSHFQSKLTGTPVELPPIQLPTAVPGIPEGAGQLGIVDRSQAAVSLQDRYPPRGGMVILDPQYTDAGRGAVERFVAEEYIIDLLAAFDSHRVELAQMLCSGLPLPYDYSGLLCETLFAQLLRLPAPRLSPVAFSALIAHAALLRPAFPKYLAGSVRQLYLRLQFLAPELAGRLADVLAHFITNMNFRWPWDRYRIGLSQPPGGPQRTFLVLVLQQLVRLTSQDHQLLLQETPEDFLKLLGKAPQFQGLPVAVPYPPPPKPPALPPPPQLESAVDAAGDGDEAMTDAVTPAAEAETMDGETDDKQQHDEDAAGGAGDVMQPDKEQQQDEDGGDQQMAEGDGKQQQQQQQQQPPEEDTDPEMVWAGKLLGLMQSRPPPQLKPLTCSQIEEWMLENQMREELGSAEAVLRATGRAVLAAGSKSCSHCYVLIERYSTLLHDVLEQAGADAGQQVLLELLGDMYSQMTQRLSLALARFNEVSLLSPSASVAWITASSVLQFGPAPHEAAASDAWQLLRDILAGTFARYEGAIEHKARLEDGVRKAQTKLKIASDESAAAVEAQQTAEEAAAAAGDDATAQRQRIEWSAGSGREGRSGPMHRVEVAAMREQLMVKKLAAAEQALTDQDALIQRLQGVREEALLLAFKGLISRLVETLHVIAQQVADAEAAAAAGPADDEEPELQDEEQQQRAPAAEVAAQAIAHAEAARRLCLEQMRGFARTYRSQVVQLQLAEQLLQLVEASNMPDEDVKAAVLGPLHLV